MGTNTDQNTSPSKEKTEPTTAPASKNAKGAKNANIAKSKKKAYQIVGGCVAAALLIACIGFASCTAGGSPKTAASPTPTASAKAETLFANAKEVTLLDANGKETTDKITVASVKKADATQASLKDWYFNDVVKNGYKYGILKFSDESGKGIYADSTGIYEGNLKEDTATKGYTKPADTDLVYTVDASKKTFTPTSKEKSSAFPEATASAETAEATEESKDTAAETGSNTSSESGKSGNSGTSSSNASKPAGGSSNSSGKSSSNSGKKACTPYTIHHDAVTHQETTYTTVHHDAVTTQQWVQDTAAWDEQVDTGKGVAVCGNCGRKFNSAREVGEHIQTDHDGYGNYWVEPVYETVHHDATGHYETVVTQAAYDEQVPSGTKTVVDQAAWDETGCK